MRVNHSDSALLACFLGKIWLLSCGCIFAIDSHTVSYTMDDLVFDWEEDTPLVVDSTIELPQHNLVNSSLEECHQVYSSGK